ncbi:MAG TPA: bifunctional diaminohydroxyphosphoribosylaminopyrimidine deaminase/5-amino-6-(5-phosphoribosylamino)uracil reductase RibD [Bacteroidales bacterium]|nr:bifunctional diaminohydroxyphosphoribosylaminopyrimidine deaminase/5-amino-6-(5-phosphoribosylamino)uracil reductase RibD [Bacteroidales bacterium]
MEEDIHIKFMKRCIELAANAEGMTFPNPMVGSVIVHDGKIIGEGYHLRAGLPHAEVNAINSVQDKEKLKSSVLYVNLEPCSHYGKTPPCADLIIASSIPEVVIGAVDTSDKVHGEGIARLRRAGCKVTTGVLEKESRWLNRRFFTYNEKKRPYIILKWAESSDGFMDIDRRADHNQNRPTWISGKPERVLVHRWRADEQSILVGAGTLKADRPQLNVRDWSGNNPLRIILSGKGSIINDPFLSGYRENSVIFTAEKTLAIDRPEVAALNDDEPACIQITRYLYEKGLQSLFVEGGATVLGHFIEEDMWDEARIFKGFEAFSEGIKAPAIAGSMLYETAFSGSTLSIFLNY